MQVVLAALRNETSIAEVCRRYGINRYHLSQVTNIQKTFLQAGLEGLNKYKGSSDMAEIKLGASRDSRKPLLRQFLRSAL